MIVIPAVDIRGGKCVQLVGGEPGTGNEYGSPVEAALRWEEKGASGLHVVDLDAAMNEGENMEEVAEILANVSLDVQVSGGIRSIEKACELLGIGADRVILGTAAFENPALAADLIEKSGSDSVFVALDVKKGKIAVEGWKERAEEDVTEMAKKFEKMGVGGFLFTNVDVEGQMTGLNPEPIRELVSMLDSPVIAAGGVRSLEDVKKAREAGAAALVIGTALYEEELSLEEVMEVTSE